MKTSTFWMREGINTLKNLAIIGYGGMGGWHAQHADGSDAVRLSGIWDIDEKRRELARSRGIRAYAGLEELLGDPEVDLVTLAVPNDVHRELAVAALEAGKNVISEKPVTLACEDLSAMIDAANRCGRLFTVHQNRRWDVDYLAMKHLADSGELGELIRVESRIHGSRGIPSDWRGQREHGGGMLYDWGVHLIDQMLLLIPEPIRRVACEFTHLTNREVDDGFRLELSFDGGRTAYVEVGTYNFIELPRFYLQAMKGTAMVRDWREPCEVVRCKHWHESEVVPVQTAAGLTKTMAPRDEITVDRYRLPIPHSDVHDFYRNVCRAIDGKEAQLVTHAQMMRVMRVIEASFRSVDCGQGIAVDI